MKRQLVSIKCASESIFTSLWMEMAVCDGEVRLMFEEGDQAIWLCASSADEMRKMLETALEMLDQLTNAD
jgi:hypothetical protein